VRADKLARSAANPVVDGADDGDVDGQESSSTAADAVGYRWLLTSVRTAEGVVDTAPIAQEAWTDLQHDGQLVCFDSVNVLSGGYDLTATGLETHVRGTTLVGYDGCDPARVAVIAAVGALADLTGEGRRPVAVSARVVAQELVLTVPGRELTFRRAGHIADR
jgi:hypothetical protein